MKQFGVAVLLIIFCFFAWLFAGRLSSDAVGMAVGLVFGVLSGVPTALLVMAANRQRGSDDDGYGQGGGRQAMLLDNPTPAPGPLMLERVTERVYAPVPSTAIQRRVPSCYVRPLTLETREHDDDNE